MTARQIAKAWRANPADRGRIERQIAVEGRQSEFRRDEAGNLYARITPEIRAQINGSDTKFGTSADRRFASEMLDPAIVRAAGVGIGFQRESHTGLIHCGEDARRAA